MPTSIDCLNWKTIFEWHVVRCRLKGRHYMCLNEIILDAQNMLPILSSIINIIEGTYTII